MKRQMMEIIAHGEVPSSGVYDILDRTDMSSAPHPQNRGSMEKADKYEWIKLGKKGELRYIDKKMLGIDVRYQRREVSQRKILKMGKEFNWLACGCISVIQRRDGTYWIYDGGHRVRAAFYRSEVVDIPCIVFKAEDISTEADAFITTNTTRAIIKSWNMYQAGLTAGRDYAIETKSILDQHGLNATCNREEKNGFSAIATLMNLVKADKLLARKVLGVCANIGVDEGQIPSMTLKGLFVLYQAINRRYAGKKGYDILSGEYVEKLKGSGLKGIENSIYRYKLKSGMNGTRMAAMAILEILNKGRKGNRIILDGGGK